MDSALVINSPLNSTFRNQSKVEKGLCQKPFARSDIAIEISSVSYKKATRPSTAAKTAAYSHVLNADEKHQRDNLQDLYSQLPDTEELEMVSEAQAKSILVNVHSKINELTDLSSQSDKSVNRSSKPLNDFTDKSFQYLVYKLQGLFLTAFQDMAGSYAKANQALREGLKAQIEASRQKEQERFKQISEEKAWANKSGTITAAADWVCGIFALGSFVATGGLATITFGAAAWLGTGLVTIGKALCEQTASGLRAAGNDKQAEEFDRAAMVLGILGMVCLVSALRSEAVKIAAETAAKNIAVKEGMAKELSMSLVELEKSMTNSEAAITSVYKEQLAGAAQQALEAEELTVELEVIKKLQPPLEKSFQGLESLISESLASQLGAAQFAKRIFYVLSSLGMASNAFLKAQIAQCTSRIDTLSTEAGALQQFAQTVTQQVIKSNTENLKYTADQIMETLKLTRTMLIRYAETIRLTNDSMHVAA